MSVRPCGQGNSVNRRVPEVLMHEPELTTEVQVMV